MLDFPALITLMLDGNFPELQKQAESFDRHLRAFLNANGVALNDFATLDELQGYLRQVGAPVPSPHADTM